MLTARCWRRASRASNKLPGKAPLVDSHPRFGRFSHSFALSFGVRENTRFSKLADFLTACCKFQLGSETFFDPTPLRVVLRSQRATSAGFFGPQFFLWN